MPKSLNEISKGTLHSYRDKARLQSKVNKRNAKTMDNVAKQRAKAGDNKGMSQALDSAKRKRMVAYKRDAGSDKALQKMQEIAQSSTINHMLTPAKNVKVLKKGTVSELDDKTLKSYEDKAVADADKKRKAGDYAGHSKRYSGIHKSQMKRLSRATDRLKKSASDLRQATNKYLNKEETLNERGLSASEKRDREDIVKGMKKNKTDFMKRYGRDHEAVMYATATKLAKQDEETIKEISTDTLVNYAKAADASMKKDSSKQNVKKRIKGLANVGKRLADRKFNEETLHELDKDTLKSYVGKAQAERLHNIDKFQKQSKRGESIIAKSALKKVQKRGLGIRQAQKKLGEAEFDADKPKRGIQRKRVNLQFGRQQRHNPTPFKKDQQQDLYKKSDPLEKKIRKSRENKRFPDYRQDKDTGVIKKEFSKGGEHSKKYGGVQNKKTKPDALVHKEDIVINQLKTLMSEKKSLEENFKDGRNPQDKGDAKRHGLSGKQSTSSLKKVRSSDSASPRKKQLAHWILNMRKGRNKNK